MLNIVLMFYINMTHSLGKKSMIELKWLPYRFAFESESTQMNKIGLSDIGR